MDPEFTKVLTRVLFIGGSMGVVGFAVLFLAFRAFRTREFRATVLVAALLAFVFACCVILLRFSILR